MILTDADGRPVADAELAVVVVDEAILALTNYQLADPQPIGTAQSCTWQIGRARPNHRKVCSRIFADQRRRKAGTVS